MTQQYKRKKILINPRMQGRVLRDCCTAPLIALVSGSLIVAFLMRMVQSEAASLEVELPTLGDLTMAMTLFVIACTAVILYHGIHFSHRIAGPLYRLRMSMDQLMAGQTDFKMRLREKDYMHETASHFNQLVSYVADRNAEVERLRSLLAENGIESMLAEESIDVESIDAPQVDAANEKVVEQNA